jgi:hypothetical protein
MASITGLANIKNLIDRPRSESGPKARWLKLEDGQSVKIRYLNEEIGRASCRERV